MNHIIYMNASCHTYQWVTSHIDESYDMYPNSHPLLTSHGTYINDICVTWLIHECLMHVAHMNESCHMYECVMSHMSQVSTELVMEGSLLLTSDEWVMSHMWICHKCEFVIKMQCTYECVISVCKYLRNSHVHWMIYDKFTCVMDSYVWLWWVK